MKNIEFFFPELLVLPVYLTNLKLIHFSGAFGVVNRAEKDGTQFAVKTLKCVRLQQRKDAEREIAILQQIENGNICKLTAACRSGRNIFMVMEL